MIEVEVSRTFAAPVERVWARYTDHASWTQWSTLGTATVIRQGTPPPNGVGAVRRIATAGIGVEEEVVDFEPPRRMTYRLVKGGFPITNHLGEVLFAPSAGGTTLVWRVRCDSAIPGTGLLLAPFLRFIFNRALAGLARDLGA